MTITGVVSFIVFILFGVYIFEIRGVGMFSGCVSLERAFTSIRLDL